MQQIVGQLDEQAEQLEELEQFNRMKIAKIIKDSPISGLDSLIKQKEPDADY